jgi:hypothetical protein
MIIPLVRDLNDLITHNNVDTTETTQAYVDDSGRLYFPFNGALVGLSPSFTLLGTTQTPPYFGIYQVNAAGEIFEQAAFDNVLTPGDCGAGQPSTCSGVLLKKSHF